MLMNFKLISQHSFDEVYALLHLQVVTFISNEGKSLLKTLLHLRLCV